MKIINAVQKYKMKYKIPKSSNYCATVVKLDKFVELQNCDNVKHALIFGNSVIVDKYALAGSMAIYFPVETRLSVEFLSANNLYRNNLLKENKEEKGYFEESGRIKCMRFRGHKSEGFYIPLISLSKFATVSEISIMTVGEEFDEINGVSICEKYVIASKTQSGKGAGSSEKRISRIVNDQFRLHVDTNNLRKNIYAINPDDVVSGTYKLHGTSFTLANVLTVPKLKWYEKLLFKIINKTPTPIYDVIYASRRVVKNEFETYIYRITYTNVDGKVFQFSYSQLVEYCFKYGFQPVPKLFYCKTKDIFPIANNEYWHETFLKMLQKHFLEKKCHMCVNDVPAEGIVLKVDRLFDCEPYKLKSFAFLERETKELDKQVIDIESEN